MALTGSQKAYLQARSGIARAGASRSNYVFPLYGVITVNGLDITPYVQYGTLRVTQALNEEPDTAAFDVLLTDSVVAGELQVSAEVVIGLGGPTDNPLFGGRILTAQTTRRPGRTPSVRSVMCADYLQVLDSEYLITYDWPPQSATTTILDLIARFANKPGGVAISTAGVAPGLPSHASVAVANERCSTILRRLVTMFPTGGGFYVDPLKVLHVWAGASEPDVVNPSLLTLDNPLLKAFAEIQDGAQIRDAAVVEGMRTEAPIGTPGPDPADSTGRTVYSLPVIDASIINVGTDPYREVRIGTQRYLFQNSDGVFNSPPGTPQSAVTTLAVPFDPDPSVEGNLVTIAVDALDFLTGRTRPWIKIEEQYLKVVATGTTPSPYVQVPRTGFGAMIGPIQIEAVVTAAESLATGTVTGRYDAPGSLEQVRPQPVDAEVVMTVYSSTAPAVHEHLVQDGRYNRFGAFDRGVQEITDFPYPLISIAFETEDLHARPGRLQAYHLVEPPLAPMAGEYMILTAELTWPVWGLPPRRQCHAAAVRAANVVDAWLVDPR